MLSSEVLQKLGFEKHQYPKYVEWVIVSHYQHRDYAIREILPHIDYNLDYGRYLGTQFELPRSETKICFLHDLLEHLPCLDPTYIEVVIENAKKTICFIILFHTLTTKIDMLENDRLLAGIEEAAKKLAECSEGIDAMRGLSDSIRWFGLCAGHTSGKAFSMLDYFMKSYQPKRKMPRKQKKALIKKNGRAAYYAWQKPKHVIRPSLSHWAFPVFEPIRLTMPKPTLKDRNLLFLMDLWPKEYGFEAVTNRIWEGYKPVLWVPDIG